MPRCPKCKHEFSLQPRSAQANAYWWGCVLPALADYYNRTRENIFPVHPSVVHEEIKRSVLGVDERGNVLRSRDLDSAEFAKMTDAARDFLATKGIRVPSPDEPWEDNR